MLGCKLSSSEEQDEESESDVFDELEDEVSSQSNEFRIDSAKMRSSASSDNTRLGFFVGII